MVNVMRERYLTDVEEYCGKLEPYMAELEQEGSWKLVERVVVDDYSCKSKGVIHVFQIL